MRDWCEKLEAVQIVVVCIVMKGFSSGILFTELMVKGETKKNLKLYCLHLAYDTALSIEM